MGSDGHAAGHIVAGNLRVLREGVGISQAVLAADMRDRGWRWHQTTVRRIEHGDQPLELGEAVDLAAVLGVTLDRLMAAGEEETGIRAASQAAGDLRAAWTAAVESIRALRDAAAAARGALPAAKSSRHARVRELAVGIESAVGECTLGSALGEAGERKPGEP